MKIAIIGAGASGCFAAANIHADKDYEVVIFEKSSKCLQKVKVSGGGRCNVTNGCFDVDDLLLKYPRGKALLRKSLYRFGPSDTIHWFESRGVQIKLEEDGRMFPVSNQSETIIRCLLDSLNKNKTEIKYRKSVKQIQGSKNGFQLLFEDQSVETADRILIATGGFPKREQFSWIENLGHTIVEPVPSLFTFNIPNHAITELMGVSVDEVTLKITGTKIIQHGPVLITHWGLSGPVVLRTSAWAARELAIKDYQFTIQINWLNDVAEEDLKLKIGSLRSSHGKNLVYSKNPFGLPKRLWEFLMDQSWIKPDVKWGELKSEQQKALIENTLNYKLNVTGKTTFKEEFVTCGGVPLSEINLNTMESKIVPGMYFAGEILDVDGITGGFNFQHAWSSAYIAAQEITH